MKNNNTTSTIEKEKFLTYVDLSNRWQIPVSTLRIYVMQRKLKPLKIRRHVRFKLSYIKEIENIGMN
jgi:hypothetical protein